jgi:hypothetical protein
VADVESERRQDITPMPDADPLYAVISSAGNSGDVPVHVGLKKLARSVAWLGRSDSRRGVGCVFPAQQLKREQSLASCFSRADASCHGISNTLFACGIPKFESYVANHAVGLHAPVLFGTCHHISQGRAAPEGRPAAFMPAPVTRTTFLESSLLLQRQPASVSANYAVLYNDTATSPAVSHTLSVRCRAARGRQPSWRSPRAYRVEANTAGSGSPNGSEVRECLSCRKTASCDLMDSP